MRGMMQADPGSIDGLRSRCDAGTRAAASMYAGVKSAQLAKSAGSPGVAMLNAVKAGTMAKATAVNDSRPTTPGGVW